MIESKNLSPDRFRLACRFIILEDHAISLPAFSLIPKTHLLARGTGKAIPLDLSVKKIAVRPFPPVLHSPHSLLDGLKKGLGLSELCLAPETIFTVAEILSGGSSGEVVTAILDGDEALRSLERSDTTARFFGLAVDLGTTTLAIDIVDLGSGNVVDTAVGINGQSSFGADVVTRIKAAYRDPAQAAALRRAVLASINSLISGLLRSTGIRPVEIYETVIAGNTAMSHFFLGLPVDGLAVAPFSGVFSVAPLIPAGRLGLDVNPLGRVYLSPNLQSFVGGDITAGLIATDLASRSGNVLFLDLGTTGELVLKTERGMTATSTAAGPAFEGMSISCGLSAQPGAIDKAFLTPDRSIAIETIGRESARGICGTGLVDLIAAFIHRGDLSIQGRIQNPEKRLLVTSQIFLTQQDVREIQLAMAAVKAGIHMLLAAEWMSVHDLDEVLVAGAFGAFLNVGNSVSIGLLPRLPPGRVRFVGNTSLEGARALLLSRTERRLAERLSREVRHLPLAQDEAFQQTFIEALDFREWPDDSDRRR